MKITNFGTDGLPQPLSAWSTGVVSYASNALFTATSSNTLAINGVRVTGAAASNYHIVASGSNFAAWVPDAAGGAVSFGSNAMSVSDLNVGGASTNAAREDHRHVGIATITASSSNTLQRPVINLRPGSGVTFALSTTDGNPEFDTLTIGSTATGGGSAIAVRYPGLKPTTPTDDFNTATLGAGWSAHALNASGFTTSHVLTQGEDWIGSSVALMFSEQAGTIYQTHANGDIDFQVGGIRVKGMPLGGTGTLQWQVGIAAVDTSGNGMCVTVFNDQNAYFAPVVSYVQSGAVDSWSYHGLSPVYGASYNGDWWMRLKRVSGTWTGYISRSGRKWDKTFATSTAACTIAELHFGSMRAGVGSGIYIADYFHVDV